MTHIESAQQTQDQDGFIPFVGEEIIPIQSNEDVKTACPVNEFTLNEIIKTTSEFKPMQADQFLEVAQVQDRLIEEKKELEKEKVFFWLSLGIAVVGFLRK